MAQQAANVVGGGKNPLGITASGRANARNLLCCETIESIESRGHAFIAKHEFNPTSFYFELDEVYKIALSYERRDNYDKINQITGWGLKTASGGPYK